MKKFFKFLLMGLGLISIKGYSQNCQNVSYNIGDNPYICANSYGDANGKPIWDWEVIPGNIHYCEMWHARTQSQNNSLEIMGSPFVNPSIDALKAIYDRKDYTRANGWELLTRNFGCSKPTSYPYFVLYNRYSGLTRVYIYMPGNSAQYSGALLQIKSVSSTAVSNARYPATLASGDASVTAPDKYLNPDNGNLTNTMFVVTQTAGSSNWSVATFNPGFDPYIENSSYKESALEFTVFGVTNSTLTATLTGTSASSTNPGDPVLSDISYRPNSTVSTGTGPDGGKKFTATGEKFVKFAKTADEVRKGINEAALKIFRSIDGNIFDPQFQKTLKGRIKGLAFNIEGVTNSASDVTKTFGSIASAFGAGGQALTLIGGVIGLFSDEAQSSAPAPTYTAYNLALNGEITTKFLTTTFMLKIPGTDQDNSNPNTKNLATYYSCPLGIFNINNTPEADVVTYKRATEVRYGPSVSPGWKIDVQRDFVSYKLRNNLNVSVNSGAGVELVSAQAAIVGKVLPTSGDNPNAAYDLLQEYNQSETGSWPVNDYSAYSYNYMLPDLQAGILEVTNYEPDRKLHTFQTPYRDLGCLSGLTFNARAETDIFLRVKAILKKKNDPGNKAIYFIQDYKIKQVATDMDGDLRNDLASYNSHLYPTPFSNSSEIPRYNVVDLVIKDRVYNSYWDEHADNSISTENTVLVKTGQSVIFKAGEISLEDGFETEANAQFEAILRKSELSFPGCGTSAVESFVPTLNGGNCYNTIPQGLRVETKPTNTVNKTVTPELLKVYPIPTNGKLFIEGVKANSKTTITILDQSGRLVKELRSTSFEGGRIDVDVSLLSNGVYFVKVQTFDQVITRKIVVNK